jgi:hypothetical protein
MERLFTIDADDGRPLHVFGAQGRRVEYLRFDSRAQANAFAVLLARYGEVGRLTIYHGRRSGLLVMMTDDDKAPALALWLRRKHEAFMAGQKDRDGV